MQNASREGLGSQVEAMGLGFAGVPGALGRGPVLTLVADPRAPKSSVQPVTMTLSIQN
jgi:hypothetical protein